MLFSTNIINSFHFSGSGLLSQLILLSDSLSQTGGQDVVRSGEVVQGLQPSMPVPPIQSIPPPPFSPGISWINSVDK